MRASGAFLRVLTGMSNAGVKSLANNARRHNADANGGESDCVQSLSIFSPRVTAFEVIVCCAVVALIVVAGLVYYSQQPKVYEARSAVQLTTDIQEAEGFKGLLPSAEQAERALLVKYDIVNKSSRGVLYPRISGVWRLSDTLFVSAQGHKAEEAAAFLRREVSNFLQEAQKTYQAVVSSQERRIERLKADEQEISRLVDALAPQEPRFLAQNPALLLVSGVEKAKLLEQLVGIRDQVETARALLIRLQGGAISLLRDAALSNDGAPIEPKLSAVLGVSGILGAIVALAVIFARRAYQRVIRGIKSEALRTA